MFAMPMHGGKLQKFAFYCIAKNETYTSRLHVPLILYKKMFQSMSSICSSIKSYFEILLFQGHKSRQEQVKYYTHRVHTNKYYMIIYNDFKISTKFSRNTNMLISISKA